MTQLEGKLEVNRLARRERHMRVFSKSGLWRVRTKNALQGFARSMANTFDKPFLKPLVTAFQTISSIKGLVPDSPQKKLMTQMGALATLGLLFSSFSAAGTFTPVSMNYSDDYIDSYSLPGDILVADDSGYLVKANPQTGESNRIGLTDYAVHSVASGEALSVIAEKYSVSSDTIMWANNLSNPNALRIGQSLLIPPVDGIEYNVASGDNLQKIATKYDITVDAIIAQNGLEGEVITKGQKIFLPGAEPIGQPISTIASSYRNTSTYSNVRIDAASSDAVPAAGRIFIFPTRGKVTQGFHGGHYALDIADRSKPPIWAAGGGTVEKVSVGTWGGGYGNHVIINHGDGIKTLYAHMDSVNVSVGDYVSQGDVLGIMGNTGRVYGATGIHLHWEVIVNGVRQNPYNYF